MKLHKLNIIFLTIALFISSSALYANTETEAENKEVDVKEMIMHHLMDSYEWNIVTTHHTNISIPLPVILYSKTTGWHIFMSSVFEHGTKSYRGFEISHDEEYKGKIIENTYGTVSRPFDISITKNVVSLIISSLLLIWLIMYVTKELKRNPLEGKKGITGAMEILIRSIVDDVIMPSIGKGFEKYSPYLLTLFFFIFINNLLGLVPFFPGGANVTGNIAITFTLALITFLIVQFSGTKKHFKNIVWPDVPIFLKIPIPLMPILEFIDQFTRPFALMIRLFANMMGGHAMVMGLISVIFLTVGLGVAGNASMMVISVLLTTLIFCIELLVAFIQAYIFTLLSATFIGMSRHPH